MKKNLKVFLLGMAVMGLMNFNNIFANATKTIQGVFGRVKVVVDGKEIKEETLSVDGVTYLPLRAVAESLHMDVDFVKETQTALLTSKTTSIPPTKTEEPKRIDLNKKIPNDKTNELSDKPGYSFENPARLGDELIYTDKYSDYKVKIKALETLIGDEAWKVLLKANRFNSPAPEGKKYVLTKVRVELLESNQDVYIGKYSFHAYSKNGYKYLPEAAVTPEPDFPSSLSLGKSAEGWLVFVVDKDDDTPIMAYGEDKDKNGGIWCKLTNNQ